jgi:hypothetical protein
MGIGFLLLSAGAAQAQLTVTSISANPQQPEDGDMVLFTVDVAAPGSCFTDPTQEMTGEIDGTNVSLLLPACADVGLPNDTNFTFQAMVGQFQVDGTYEVQVFRNSDFPDATPVGTQSLIVMTPGGDTIGGGNGNGQGLCGFDPCYKASTNACPTTAPTVKPEPCNLILDLTNAINKAPTLTYWRGWLDSTFINWTIKMDGATRSENKPVLAAAIALWESPTTVIDPSTQQPFAAYKWWLTFLNCQNDGTANCAVATANTTMQYFNGSEILSNTYGGMVTLAVAAVALWAEKNPSMDPMGGLAAAAHHYLQITMGLWTLGAGSTWANTLTYPHAAGAAATSESCEGGSFNMPFLALAGARSVIDHSCDDDRAPILASAIGYQITGQCQEPTWNNRLREAIQCAWVPDQYGDNVYGVTPTVGSRLQGFIGASTASGVLEGDKATASAIVGILAGARFIDEYDFLLWNGVRATALFTNPNTNTSPTYSMSFAANGQAAAGLWPWEQDRNNITAGYCRLVYTNSTPTGAVASDCDAKGRGCPSNPNVNPPQTQTYNFPPPKAGTTQLPSYFHHVILTSNADAVLQQ